MPRLALLLALPALAFGVSACGDQTADLEKEVKDEISARGYEDANVDCPSDVDDSKGATFTCDVTGVEGVTEVTYKVIDDDGNVEEQPQK